MNRRSQIARAPQLRGTHQGVRTYDPAQTVEITVGEALYFQVDVAARAAGCLTARFLARRTRPRPAPDHARLIRRMRTEAAGAVARAVRADPSRQRRRRWLRRYRVPTRFAGHVRPPSRRHGAPVRSRGDRRPAAGWRLIRAYRRAPGPGRPAALIRSPIRRLGAAYGSHRGGSSSPGRSATRSC